MLLIYTLWLYWCILCSYSINFTFTFILPHSGELVVQWQYIHLKHMFHRYLFLCVFIMIIWAIYDLLAVLLLYILLWMSSVYLLWLSQLVFQMIHVPYYWCVAILNLIIVVIVLSVGFSLLYLICGISIFFNFFINVRVCRLRSSSIGLQFEYGWQNNKTLFASFNESIQTILFMLVKQYFLPQLIEIKQKWWIWNHHF